AHHQYGFAGGLGGEEGAGLGDGGEAAGGLPGVAEDGPPLQIVHLRVVIPAGGYGLRLRQGQGRIGRGGRFVDEAAHEPLIENCAPLVRVYRVQRLPTASNRKPTKPCPNGRDRHMPRKWLRPSRAGSAAFAAVAGAATLLPSHTNATAADPPGQGEQPSA